MGEASFWVRLMETISLGFVIRCGVPLVIMLAASQMLKHYHFIGTSSIPQRKHLTR